MKDIYLMKPVNKTASLVVNQAGCSRYEGLQSKRKSLVMAIDRLEEKITEHPRLSKERAELGKRKIILQGEISKINKEIKIMKDAYSQNEKTKRSVVYARKCKESFLSPFIVDVVRSDYSEDGWEEVIKKARENRKLKSDLAELEAVKNIGVINGK